jgi:hypothetical protein
LIERLRYLDSLPGIGQTVSEAADMLEADEQGMKDAFASGMSCRPASVQERDKLQAAARLALEKMNKHWHYEFAEAITALNGALK